MHYIIFEDDLASNFYPLTYTRPTFDLMLGTRTLLEDLLDKLKIQDYSLIVPPYLADITSIRHKDVKVNPEVTEDESMFVNSLLKPKANILSRILAKKEPFAAYSGENVAVAKLNREASLTLGKGNVKSTLERKLRGKTKKYALPEDILVRYPWQMIETNPHAIHRQLRNIQVDGETFEATRRVYVKGPRDRLLVERDVLVEDFVAFDTSNGPIFVGEGSEIQACTRISGPCYVGRRATVHSALIRGGTTIGDFCRIGGEVDQSIFIGRSNKAHSGFIGHSYVGEWVNIGADTCNSDLKNTYGIVKMTIRGKGVNTGSIKMGCLFGDNAKTSIGSYVYTGRKIGVASQIHGYVAEDVPSFTICAKTFREKCGELSLKSAVTTQKRMMNRRGVKQTEQDVDLLRRVFELTQDERNRFGVVKGRFTL